MKTIQSKFIALTLACVIVSTAIVSLIATIKTSHILQDDSANYLIASCRESADEIDYSLEKVELAVETIYQYADMTARNNAAAQTDWYRDEPLEKLIELQGKSASRCLRAYLLPKSDLASGSPGITYEAKKDGGWERLSDADQYTFQKMDAKTAGRYRVAEEQRNACWIGPFYDGVLQKNVITYMSPLVSEGEFLGVVGMDIDLDMMREKAEKVKVYSKGSACIISPDGSIIYHERYKDGCQINSLSEDEKELFESIQIGEEEPILRNHYEQDQCVIAKKLRNGMGVCILASIQEITRPQWDMLYSIVLAVFISALAVVGVSLFLTRLLLFPLKRLTELSRNAAEGQVDIRFGTKYQDEVGEIGRNLEKIVDNLNYYVAYKEKYAHRDALTGVMNLQAYEKCMSEVDVQIKNGEAAFGIVSMDIIGLGQVNEELGHEVGDLFVRDAVALMKKVYGESCVYRIHSDKFVAILTNTELMEYHSMSQLFMREIDKFNRVEHAYGRKLTVARGVGVFEKGRDATYADVYRRAENLMRQNKKWIKGQS